MKDKNLKDLEISEFDSIEIKSNLKTIATYYKCFFVGNFIGYSATSKDDITSFEQIITIEDIKEEAQKIKNDFNNDVIIVNNDTGITIEI